MLDTPVLFLVFNRPDTTAQVFERIRQAAPRQLFIAADGPRPERPDDVEKCRQVREIVANVDWECEVRTLFREHNLGCGVAPATAITWFFEQVEEGIILEDDCLPSISFFDFCRSLLAYYREDEFVMHISGNNFQFGKQRGEASYYFSKYTHNWGWATWRESWRNFNFSIKNYEVYINSEAFSKKNDLCKEREYWINYIKSLSDTHRDVWDVQWLLTVWRMNGISILPNVNLIQNIGIGLGATHTTYEDQKLINNRISEINSEMRHPKNRQIDKEADYFTFNNYFFQKTSIINKFRNFAYKVVPARLYKELKKMKTIKIFSNA